MAYHENISGFYKKIKPLKDVNFYKVKKVGSMLKDKWTVSFAFFGAILILSAYFAPVNYETFKWIVWIFMSTCFLRCGYKAYIKTRRFYWPVYFIALCIILFIVFLNKHVL